MWYILIMNKDVIYIEPEDDITDIISKIEGSKEKIVALVPPKKAGVFRSVVNIKLISKAGATSEKTVVLVTTDPSIIKIASATKMPVTKDLQTPPAVPNADVEVEEVSKEEVVEEPEDDEEDEKEEKEEEEKEEKETPKDKEKEKKIKKAKKVGEKTGNLVIDWVKSHKKLTIFGGVGVLLLIIFLIWAFAIAPAATVIVEIQTESKNFAENVNFTTNAADENIKDGKLYLQEKKIESVQEIKFDATGQKNKGEKASGKLDISVVFAASGTISINAGTKFTINDLTYLANENTSLQWDGNEDNCENDKGRIVAGRIRCEVSGVVSVTASEAGTKYNIAPSSSGWNTISGISVVSTEAMTGGTDDIVTVVEQSDVEKAKDQLKTSNESENKKKLYDGIDDNMLIIESSFKQETSTAEATPAAGEEVKEGVTPVLKATTTATVYVVEKTKVEEFIAEKAKLNEDQKIYEINNPFIENFVATDGGFTGRLKTSYAVGPKVTESEIVDIVKGKGIGDVQHQLKDINGIVSVTINPSYPWVNTIPNDTNKITIELEIKKKES